MVTRTPLLCVDAVVLDTETTGLDPRSARMVQIGALELQGQGRTAREFVTLVSPGVSVPAASSAIHGITDADLTDAPATQVALAALLEFIDGRPVIGHAIGFDVAVIAAEARRLGMPAAALDVLDTRLLAELVAPTLPDFTLETLSAWLGVALEQRHQAIGDARATAAIFTALLPHLRARGIRSWAEAVAASRGVRQSGPLEAGVWAAAEQPSMPTAEPLSRIDSYPYRHRIKDVMSSPPVVLAADRMLSEAVAAMTEAGISSVFVAFHGSEDGEGGPGILTERDVLRALAEGGPGVLQQAVRGFASRPLQSVRAEGFIYRAIGRMERLKLRHLGVVDEAGALVGALSARDLLRLRASEAIRLGDGIETAEDAVALAAAWAPLPLVAEALLAEGVAATDVTAVISREMGVATRQAAKLAEASLSAAGELPPVPYSVLVLGSAGRGESMLALDQDNAIVFQRGEPGGAEDAYFARLGAHMADTLDAIGIPYCRGGVMAREPGWRGSAEAWRRRVAQWLARSSPEDLLSIDIFFDAAVVHGDARLAEDLLAAARSEAAGAPGFLKLLAAASPIPPGGLGAFGRFRTDDGRIDLKRNALLPIVSSARVLSLRHGIAARSTQERLRRLAEVGHGGGSDLAALRTGHEAVLAAILSQQLRDGHAGVPPSNRVEPARLPRASQDAIKAVLRIVPRVDDLVRDMLF